MRVVAKVLGLMAIAGAVLAVPAPSGAESAGAIRVGLVEGDVQLRIAETGEWVPVAVNTPLFEGDELWVPDGSRVALQTNSGSHVRLDERSALEILRTDRDSFQFHLGQGHAYVLSRAPKRSVVQIDTPDASVRSFGKAAYRVDVPEDETDVAVFKGSVLAESDAGTTKVRRGDMLVLEPGGYAELTPLPAPDDWERWNYAQDRIVLARGESTRYLPDELEVYADDFDRNGRWVSVPDYGNVWTPTVVVVADWAPYRHGRWCWRGGDYVWVGYEPWGWAPYHYGRWAFVARIGWCWVPPERGDVFWSPGYVGWVRTPDHVAWVPLAPRETYYGHGQYGRYGVNVTNVNVTSIQVTNVYRNVNVTNAVTVVNQTTFVTGRPGPVDRNAVAAARDDFARRRNIVVGRPPIRPAEASYAPVVRAIPEAKRPPAVVRKVDVNELRRARPLVRESERSAIRPEARPRALEVRKVETPRSVGERMRERRQGVPQERRGPGAPQGVPPGRVERGGERPQGPPPGRVRPEQPQAQPVPQERGRRETPQGTPPGRVRPEQPQAQPVPQERGRRETPQGTPPERVRPEQPQAQPVPQERGRRESPQGPPAERMQRDGERPQGPPPGRVRPEPPRTQPAPQERGRRESPQGPPAERMQRDGERPQGPPVEKVRPGTQSAPPPQRVRPEAQPTPAQPDRGVERGRRPEAPPQNVRPQKPDDNTDGPGNAPENRDDRRRR